MGGEDAILEGVVSIFGGELCRDVPDEGPTLEFTLEPWRFAGAPLNESPLRCVFLLGEDSQDHCFEATRPFRVVRIHLRPTWDPDFWDPMPVQRFDEEAEPAADLVAISERLRSPATVHTEAFGPMTRTPGLGLTVLIPWSGGRVRLALKDSETQLDAMMQHASTIVSEAAAWEQRARLLMAAELQRTASRARVPPSSIPLSEEAFQALFALEQVDVFADGGFAFHLAGGGPLRHRSIEVHGSVLDDDWEAYLDG